MITKSDLTQWMTPAQAEEILRLDLDRDHQESVAVSYKLSAQMAAFWPACGTPRRDGGCEAFYPKR